MTPLKRKTRSQRQGEKFNVGGAWLEESEIHTEIEEEAVVNSTANNNSVPQESTTSPINQIRSDISLYKRFDINEQILWKFNYLNFVYPSKVG